MSEKKNSIETDVIIQELFEMEDVLLKQSKEQEKKISEYWGMLILAKNLEVITDNQMYYRFGSFVSTLMKL